MKLPFTSEVLTRFDNKSTLFSKFTAMLYHVSELKPGLHLSQPFSSLAAHSGALRTSLLCPWILKPPYLHFSLLPSTSIAVVILFFEPKRRK